MHLHIKMLELKYLLSIFTDMIRKPDERGITVLAKVSSHKRRKKRSKFTTIVYFSLLLIYLEIVFHIIMFHNIRPALIYPVFSALTLGTVFGTVCRLFNRKVNRLLTIVITVALCVFFFAKAFHNGILSTVLALLFLLMLPIAFGLFFAPNYISVRRKPPLTHVITLAEGVIIHICMLILLMVGGKDALSAYDLYFHSFSANESADTLGVMTTAYLSGKNSLMKKDDSTVITEESSDTDNSSVLSDNDSLPIADTTVNILNIDLDKILTASENDQNVQSVADYVKAQSGTAKNSYTGLFKGYNLIWITAEGLDECIINASWTPTLYKMATQGFHFKNYYSPLWYGSTSGGEWTNLTGTVPNNGSYISLNNSGKIGLNMLFTAGRQSKRLGYAVKGWCSTSPTESDRNLSFPNMGYDWHGSGTGYTAELNESSGLALWPQSDIQLIDQSFDTYVSKEPFMTYYITSSGHAEYNFSENAMAMRNQAQVANLSYSETAKAYIACNLELEYAMQDLLQRLENAGIADRALIVLAPANVPSTYMNDSVNIVEEIKGTDLDEIESYRNTLIIYSPSMTQPVEIDKYCSSVDILPTVSNLMGWEYDSRMMIGQDILSDAKQFIAFPDLSFISDKCIYNKAQNKVTSLTGEEISNDYILEMTQRAESWSSISDLLYATDFYKYVEAQIPAATLDQTPAQ